MPKKSNTKRTDGLYAVQIYLGRVEGKRKYKTVYGKTQKEADKKAAEVKQKLNKGVDLLAEDSFGFWCDRWLKSQKTELSPERYNNCEAKLSLVKRYNYLTDVFEEKEDSKNTLAYLNIAKIQLYQLQAILDKLSLQSVNGQKDGKTDTYGV